MTNIGPLKKKNKQNMRTQHNSIRLGHLERGLVKYVFKCDMFTGLVVLEFQLLI